MKMYWYVKNPNTRKWHITGEYHTEQHIAICRQELDYYWESAYLDAHPQNTCKNCLHVLHIEKQARTQ